MDSLPSSSASLRISVSFFSLLFETIRFYGRYIGWYVQVLFLPLFIEFLFGSWLMLALIRFVAMQFFGARPSLLFLFTLLFAFFVFLLLIIFISIISIRATVALEEKEKRPLFVLYSDAARFFWSYCILFFHMLTYSRILWAIIGGAIFGGVYVLSIFSVSRHAVASSVFLTNGVAFLGVLGMVFLIVGIVRMLFRLWDTAFVPYLFSEHPNRKTARETLEEGVQLGRMYRGKIFRHLFLLAILFGLLSILFSWVFVFTLEWGEPTLPDSYVAAFMQSLPQYMLSLLATPISFIYVHRFFRRVR